MSAYQQEYKKHYKEKKAIITFPLERSLYDELLNFSNNYGITPNSAVKQVVIHFLNGTRPSFLTQEEYNLVREYTHISRGIANNINQMARSSNIGQQIDVNVLISSLKSYEDAFKALVNKLQNDH